MDLMGARRRLLMQQQGGLPGAYRAIEWIGGTGTQYIDSGIECTSDLVVEFKASVSTSANAALCGGIKANGGNSYFRHHCSPWNANIAYWLQNNATAIATIAKTIDLSLPFSVFADPTTGKAIVNGNLAPFAALESGLTTGRNYGICGRISDTGAIQSRPNHIYYFRFWRNGVQLGDFVPCVRKVDNVAGMFNLITRQFHTNAGSGTFEIPT